MEDVWTAVFWQLVDTQPEALGMDSEASYCCKSAEGMQQQMLCYSLLGSLDACLACAIPQLIPAASGGTVVEAAQAIDALFLTHAQVQDLLVDNKASRPQSLPGAHSSYLR
jgi:hypothetical protein